MRIGVPKEIKVMENRVGLIPQAVQELVNKGHQLYVESSAGLGIGASDEDYAAAGAEILSSALEVFDRAEMIVKVKEPQPIEWPLLKPEHILFTYLHLAPDPLQAQALMNSRCTAIAYETVEDSHGRLPLLTPMSEVAGRLSVLEGSFYLKRTAGGRGVLVSGVPGSDSANITILGGGVVGTNAAKLAVGMGAKVTIVDRSLDRLRELDDLFYGKVNTLYSTDAAISSQLEQADMVIGAVLVPGAQAPKLVQKRHLSSMKPGSVLVDVAIDQGGCFETSHATTHENPCYFVDDILHYCVANMPGSVPITASQALNNATLPYVMRLADSGLAALETDNGLLSGLNVKSGHIMHRAVAKALAA